MEETSSIEILEKEILALNDEAASMIGYTGGDMTGIEYVISGRLGDIGISLNKKYGDLCALKLKRLAVSFYGRNAKDNFDVVKVSDQLIETFAANENVGLRGVNEAIDCADKMQSVVVFGGENKDGDPYEYEIDIMSTGIDINESTKQKNG